MRLHEANIRYIHFYYFALKPEGFSYPRGVTHALGPIVLVLRTPNNSTTRHNESLYSVVEKNTSTSAAKSHLTQRAT
jgi:hypothetical protein